MSEPAYVRAKRIGADCVASGRTRYASYDYCKSCGLSRWAHEADAVGEGRAT